MSQEPTPKEIKQKIEKQIRHIQHCLTHGVCPHCLTPIVRKEVIGLSQYAQPCGCRLGTVLE